MVGLPTDFTHHCHLRIVLLTTRDKRSVLGEFVNANLNATDFESFTAENILLRTLKESLPELCIVSEEEELDIRDAAPNEDYMLDWHYPGRCNVSADLPEIDLEEMTAIRELATQVRRSQLVARGIFTCGQNGSSK